jgi:putative redox protein
MATTITATHLTGYAFKTELDGHPLNLDMPEDKGGTGIGPSPKSLMLIALAGCTGFDIVMILDKMRVQYSGFSVSVTGELTDTQPKIYHTVTIHYEISLAEKDRQNMEKAVKLSQEKYCGVSAMFSKFAELKSTINYKEA